MPKRPPTGSKGIGGSFESSYDGSYEGAAWPNWIALLLVIVIWVLIGMAVYRDVSRSDPACPCESGEPDVVVN